MRIFSFGGGIQSTACLILAAQGKIDFRHFVFANVGDDSENPKTIEYMEQVSMPFAKKHGITLMQIWKKDRAGNQKTLFQNLMADNRTIAIPVYLRIEPESTYEKDTAAPGNRKCTGDYKIDPIARYSKFLGATKATPAVIAIGISTDEWHRAKESQIDHQVHEFPLLDLKMTRFQCVELIKEAGLPVPPKSSCWFCPYKKLSEWREMATHDPERFELAAKLEAKRGTLGKDSVFLTRKLVPLREAVLPSDQLQIEFDEECTGYCWT